MDLEAYLQRIGLKGPLPPTLETLQTVHRAQAYAIPYEDLDVQLGVTMSLDIPAIFDKLVTRRRGGWCFESNGLLGWALGEIGFDVRRCVAGVDHRERGESAWGNHLMLLVTLEQRWLCDLGLGDGLRGPIPLVEGPHRDGTLEFRLELLPDGMWRFFNHSFGEPETFDFTDMPADEDLFLRQNVFLQSDPASYFVLNAEAIRMGPDHAVFLLGKVLRHATAEGVRKEVLETPAALRDALRAHFDITGVDAEAIWPRIEARHRTVFGT